MIRPRPYASCLLGALVLAPLASARAGEYVGGGVVNRVADRCAQFGEGFVDVGNGICARSPRSARVYVGAPRNAALNSWTGGGTSSAAMRSESESMVPGVPAQHLRVRGSLDSYNPFR